MALAAVLMAGGTLARAQEAYTAPPRPTATAAETRQNSELSDELAALGSSRPSADPYVIEGIRPLDGSSLFTRKLVFKPGAKLVIVRSRSGGPVRIRADEIVVEGASAGIFWDRPPAPTTTPSDRGKAPSGSFGRSPGMNGDSGLDGEAGNPGLPGADAIDLVLAFNDMSGGDLDVDLRGSDGGPGGRGQDGGDGGAGAQGRSASSSFFSCKAGPGQGGDGGRGGRGGPGGQGGTGGRGGSLVVMTPDLADAQRLIHAFVDGGANGRAGQPGTPGRGGEAGPEGSLAPPFCLSARRQGQNGLDGAAATGPATPTFAPTTGDFSIVPLSDQLSAELFQLPSSR